MPTQTVSAISNIRKTAASTASYSTSPLRGPPPGVDGHRRHSESTVTQITGAVLKRAARNLANVIWSLDQGTGRSPDMASLGARLRWVGVRNGDPGQVVYARVEDAAPGMRSAVPKTQISWPLPDGPRADAAD